MVARAVLVVLKFIGLHFGRNVEPEANGNGDEWEGVNDEDQAPARVELR
jgi:hypothetical protein